MSRHSRPTIADEPSTRTDTQIRDRLAAAGDHHREVGREPSGPYPVPHARRGLGGGNAPVPALYLSAVAVRITDPCSRLLKLAVRLQVAQIESRCGSSREACCPTPERQAVVSGGETKNGVPVEVREVEDRGKLLASHLAHDASVTITSRMFLRVRAYIVLTKSRVMELLLVATAPTMILAHGVIAEFVARCGDAHRWSGKLGQRFGFQYVPGPRHGCPDETHIWPSFGNRRGDTAVWSGLRLDPGGLLDDLVLLPGELPDRSTVRLCDSMVCRRVHNDPQASHRAKHRVGRNRWLFPCDHWLGSSDGDRVMAGGNAFCCNFLLDPGALLASVRQVR